MRRPHWIALIVLLLGGITVGLLIPAVQAVREAAPRMTCHSNFKGLAVELHTYAERHPLPRGGEGGAAFPTGTVPNAALSPDERLSWYVPVFLDGGRDEIFKQFDFTFGPAHPKNQKPAAYRTRHLVCPSSGEYEHDNRDGRWKSATPLTHYVGVAWVGADSAGLPFKHPRAGVFGYDRRTAFADIADGTSNTLLLIETAHNPGHWAFGGTATVRGIEPGTAQYIGPGRPFGGFHRDSWDLVPQVRHHVCIVAVADSSVRSLADTIAPEVLEALATVAGNERLRDNW